MKRSENLPTSKRNQEQKNSRSLKTLSAMCFLLALALAVALVILSLPQVQRQLDELDEWYYQIEQFIASFDKISAVAVILGFFVTKTFIPIIPFSVLFIGSGLVFSSPVAVAVNLLGFAVLVSIKFYWGRRFGGGGAHKLLLRSQSLTQFMDFHGKGNKWMLVILRFIPFIPVGTVSRAYGATDMNYIPFVSLSVLGFLPRLVAWSAVGTNIRNSFSPNFIIPLIALAVTSGVSLLLLDAMLKLIRKDVNDNDKDVKKNEKN